jgi:ribosomal protein S1
MQSDDTPTPRRGRDRAPKRTYRGTVVGLNKDDVIVELGPRLQGVAKSSEFDRPPEVGQSFEFSLKGQEDGLWLLGRSEARSLASWDEVVPGALVKAKVTGQNTGGLEAKVGPLSAFLPASHVALQRVENLGQFLGQVLECEVVEVDRDKKRIVLSRRALLERERAESRKKTLGGIATGQVVTGVVVRIESYGAFVDLGGGLEGMLHVSNLAHRRVEKPDEILATGQQIQVKVLEIGEGGKRIGLGLKQLQRDPWEDVPTRYPPETVARGRVVRLADFGAFVELEPGVDGLLHVSQLGAGQRTRRVRDLVALGQELEVRVLAVDPRDKRISLSRLDAHGAVLGSEDAAESSVIQDVIRTSAGSAATNVGALFKKALDAQKRR